MIYNSQKKKTEKQKKARKKGRKTKKSHEFRATDFITSHRLKQTIIFEFKRNIKRGMGKYPALQNAISLLPPHAIFIKESRSVKEGRQWRSGYEFGKKAFIDLIKKELLMDVEIRKEAKEEGDSEITDQSICVEYILNEILEKIDKLK